MRPHPSRISLTAALALLLVCAAGVAEATAGVGAPAATQTPAASAAATPAPTSSAAGSPAPASSLPSLVQAQLDHLAPGTVIVPCMGPSHPVLPAGVRPQRELGFYNAHPGFHYLSDGYCADNPNATPIPVVIPVVDGTAAP